MLCTSSCEYMFHTVSNFKDNYFKICTLFRCLLKIYKVQQYVILKTSCNVICIKHVPGLFIEWELKFLHFFCFSFEPKFNVLIKYFRKAVMIMIIWQLDFQLPVQSVHITTKVVSLNPVHGEVYTIQHYVIVCQ